MAGSGSALQLALFIPLVRWGAAEREGGGECTCVNEEKKAGEIDYKMAERGFVGRRMSWD